MKKIIVSIVLVTFGAFLFNAGTANAQDAGTKGATGTTIEKTTATKMCCKDPSVACTGPCKDKKDCKGDGKCSHDKKGGKGDGKCSHDKKDVTGAKAGGCSSTCKGMGSGDNTKAVKMCIKDSKTKCTNCNTSCSGYTKSETKSCCPNSKGASTGSGCPKAAGSGCSHGKSK
ncbi:MAG: hypothetical protein V2A54_09470 [Bacteroidota bacterium]